MFTKTALPAILLSSFVYFSSTAIAAPSADQPTAAAAKQQVSTHPLYFVTDREPVTKHGVTTFSNERSSGLHYGKVASLADGTKFDESKMQVFASENDFLKEIKSNNKSLAVFVHGYRKSFDGSIDFGLKMAEQMDRPLVVFAWPSKNSYFAYMKDECTAEWSAHQLSSLLGDLGENIGYRNIVLVSHSLGSRMMQWALRDLDSERRPAEKFAASLYYSPDVDRDTFIHNSALLKRTCADSQVYMGHSDARIRISRLLHGSPRLGVPVHDQTETALFKDFNCETFLRSHKIPYAQVAESIKKYGGSLALTPIKQARIEEDPSRLDGTKLTVERTQTTTP